MTAVDDLSFIRPFELQSGQPKWFNRWSTDDVWKFFKEAHSGNASAVKDLLERDPTLVQTSYWYKSPLNVAAREGHMAVVSEILRFKSLLGNSPCDDRVTIA